MLEINKQYTATITNIEIKQTSIDKQVKLTLIVFLENAQVKVTDVLYLNQNFQKRINAIYTALGLATPSEQQLTQDVANGFSIWKNKPFNAIFKRNKAGYFQPYIYIAPNTTVSEKWNDRNFGESEGKIHFDYTTAMRNAYLARGR